MTREDIGSVLKKLRLSSGKTQKEVAEILGRKQQIVGHWETGYSQPDANTLFTLCNIYGTTVDEAFGFKKKNVSITKNDITLLEKFHGLDAYGQETVSYILDREVSRVQQISNAYKNGHSAIEFPTYFMTYYHNLASAGNGEYIFEDLPTDTIEVPVNELSESADFVIGVNGDSMEPTFYDGDKVYVEKMQVVEIGDIGIFMVNNECFIKEAGKDGLISHNPKYDMIPGTENIQCIGKVLGKVGDER